MLKPGMTATARIDTTQALNVIRVPSQALRFTPTAGPKTTIVKGQRLVWVLRKGKLAPFPVTIGLNDDSYAEIKSGQLAVGDQVVTSEDATGKSARSAAAPAAALHL
jgi:HlyD family secretion protein